jgi:hypothetical protein
MMINNGQIAGGGYTTDHTLGSYTEVYNSNTGQVNVIGDTPPSSSGPGSYNLTSQPLAMSDNGQLALRGVGGKPLAYELYNRGCEAWWAVNRQSTAHSSRSGRSADSADAQAKALPVRSRRSPIGLV